MIIGFDASAFISAAVKADSVPERALFGAMIDPNHLILSQEVEEEYREVLFRPKFDRFVSIERGQLILDTVIFAAERIEPVVHVQECKDDKYLALAAAGGADCIVSDDLRHLVAMHPWRRIPILSPGDYLAMP